MVATHVHSVDHGTGTPTTYVAVSRFVAVLRDLRQVRVCRAVAARLPPLNSSQGRGRLDAVFNAPPRDADIRYSCGARRLNHVPLPPSLTSIHRCSCRSAVGSRLRLESTQPRADFMQMIGE